MSSCGGRASHGEPPTPAPLFSNCFKVPGAGIEHIVPRHSHGCGTLAHGIAPGFAALLMLQCNMAGVDDAGPFLEPGRPPFAPIAFVLRYRPSVPVFRLIAAGVLPAGSVRHRNRRFDRTDEEDPMRARLAERSGPPACATEFVSGLFRDDGRKRQLMIETPKAAYKTEQLHGLCGTDQAPMRARLFNRPSAGVPLSGIGDHAPAPQFSDAGESI